MATVPTGIEGPSDAELIDAVRKGTVSAYGSLYERHVAAAHNLARQLSRSPAEADDLVSEAFAKVLDTLRGGRGPDSAFRAYLLTALRHTAYDRTRRERRVELSDDMEATGGERVAEPFSDTAVADLERSLAARAFARLPERWQAVLWHTEIECQTPAEVAPILGLSPNGVSALAYRAREGLRQAYLQVHLAETTEARCRATCERLGAWTRHGLARREKAQVEAHLDECARCRALAAELADVNGAMRGVVAPLVLGAGTVGYLAAAAAKGGALTAAGTAAAASGAAGAATSPPRQFLGVAASGVALAVAVAIAVTAGGGTQEIPVAEPAPAQEAPGPTPAPPRQQPPAPNQPPEQPEQPAPPGQQPPAAPTPPPGQPAQPAPASLSAAPAAPLSLVGGGEAADLPLTVRNTGGSVSEPVTATLRLPPGITAVPAGDRYGPVPLLAMNGARAGTVRCPGGTEVVTCSSTAGLRPGESVTLLFRIAAAQGSAGGRITGTIMAGTMINVPVSVRVDVRPPAAVDAVVLTADAEWLGLLPGIWLHPTLEARVANTGTSSKPITVTVDQRAQLIFADRRLTCTAAATMTCTTDGPVAPGEEVRTVFELRPDPAPRHSAEPPPAVHVVATLGSARDTAQVQLHSWVWPVPPGGLVPPSPTPTPTPSSEPEPGAGSSTTEPPAPSGGTSSNERPGSPGGASAGDPPARPSTPLAPPSTPVDRSAPPRSAQPESGGFVGGLLGWLLGG